MESDDDKELEFEDNEDTLLVRHSFKTTIVKFFRNFDNQITNNFKQSEIHTRSAGGNGLWCCALLPMILLIYSCLYNVSSIYRFMMCISMGLLIYSLLYLLFLYVSCMVLRDIVNAGCIAATFCSALPLYIKYGHGLSTALIFPLMAMYMYTYFLRKALLSCPKTFTIGEAMIVCQGITLFTTMVVAKVILSYYYPEYRNTNNNMYLIECYVYTVYSTVGLIVTALYNLHDDYRESHRLALILIVAAGYTLLVLHISYGLHVLGDFISFLCKCPERLKLLTSWLAMVLLSIALIWTYVKRGGKASTGMRKVFHLLASVVFVTGILHDIEFMKLAAGLIFSVIIFVEALRKSRIPPVSKFLQEAFVVCSDEKDSGTFAMTAIYLYVGLACPLVLVPSEVLHPELELLSGVMSIGIGDSAASWFGQKFGKHKWASNKTVEGTACNIVSQLIALYLLKFYGILNTPYMFFRAAVAAIVSSLVEAQTSQVDNLVLPLVTILTFQSTFILR